MASRIFGKLLGNRETASRLSNSILKGTLPHALLLVGPRGSGKHTLAKEIAANDGKSNGKIVYGCADAGCPVAKELTETYIRYVGEGIVNLINTFQPSCVAIGGGVSAQGDKLLIPVKEYVNARTYGHDTVEPIDIVIAKLGNDAGIVGAALLAL